MDLVLYEECSNTSGGVNRQDMNEKQFLSVEEVAQRLGVTSSTIYRLARDGSLPAVKVGIQWRFSEEMLAGWANDQVALKRMLADEKKVEADKRFKESNHSSTENNTHKKPKA
jgi:excisionase family DNA binding protein